MGSTLSESSPPTPSNRQMVIQELINGRNLTTQLLNLLRKPLEDGGSGSANALAEKIYRSIIEALSILNSGETQDGCRRPRSPCSDDRKPKIPAAKDRRGEYKRRRTSRTSTSLSASPFHDGHVWRKYGQKEILGATYPRAYYRCTHKNDQGCQATKQVQKSETDPSMYVVTYMGLHTCKDVLKAPQLILDSTSRELCVLNFESTMVRKHDHTPISFFTPVKHESIGEMPSNFNQTSSSLSDYLMPSDHLMFDSHEPMTTKFSLTAPDIGDVSSSVYSSTSSHTLDMGKMDSVEFEDVLRFDELAGFF